MVALVTAEYTDTYFKTARDRLKNEPWFFWSGVVALLNGFWHKFKYLVRPRVKFGKMFRVRGKLVILGPGHVCIGDYAWIDSLSTGTTVIKTYTPASRVEIGDMCGLNGTKIHCFERIRIHDLCNIANTYIIDSSAHVLSADRRFQPQKLVPAAPVEIGPNVWISVETVVLKGVTIGANSVVGACSLVKEDVAPNVFVAGNPLRVIKTIPQRHEDS